MDRPIARKSRDHRHEDARREEREAAQVAPEHESALTRIQRSAGNRAALAAADRVGTASTTSLSDALSALRPAPDAELRPALDADAEASADRVAAGVEAKPLSLSDGGALPAEIRARLEPQLGSLTDVRVHTGRDSKDAADQMGARAFTKGRDIFLGEGERDADLLAHEAAHAAHDSTRTASDGAQLVHAKLKGTHEALVNKGGAATSGKARKAVGKLKNWDKVLENVRKYEDVEDVLMKSGTPSQTTLAKTSPKMLTLLAAVEKACVAWQDANKSDEAEALSEAWHKKSKADGNDQETDTRTKAERRQAIAMLLPRVRSEINDIKTGKWTERLSLNDKTTTSIEKGVEQGQVNSVDKIVYGAGGGGMTGYFKEEQGLGKMSGGDISSGIRQADPNWGARSVAMYRLDQLLGAGVTAKTEFATSGGKMGTTMEKAKGTKASQVKFAANKDRQAEDPGSVNLEDATLQRCLNRLQILDAIAGQLDRHTGNYFVQVGPGGEVTGVTGIDLDMAFGQDLDDPNGKVASSLSWRGMPPQIDEAFGLAILRVNVSDIKVALTGLLSEKEIAATMNRFKAVQTQILKAKSTTGLVKKWDDKTASGDRSQGDGSTDKFYNAKTYVGAQAAKLNNVYDEASDAAKVIEKEGYGPGLDDRLYRMRREELDPTSVSSFEQGIGNQLPIVVAEIARRGEYDPKDTARMVGVLINEVLGDEQAWTKMMVAIQEGDAPKDLIRERARLVGSAAASKMKKVGSKVNANK